jgi:outer membrane protein assembly factor BamE (lipoprotein component of BamABCDE complex)
MMRPLACSTSPRPALRRLRFTCALLLLAGTLSACQSRLEVRGIELDPQALSQVKPGTTTKAQVAQLLGTPSNVSTFNPDVWYYISSRDTRVPFENPVMLDQKIYVVEFDDFGRVKDIQMQQNSNREVAMNARTTPAPGKELTVFEQLIGNFGRFSRNTSTPAGAGNAGSTINPGGV